MDSRIQFLSADSEADRKWMWLIRTPATPRGGELFEQGTAAYTAKDPYRHITTQSENTSRTQKMGKARDMVRVLVIANTNVHCSTCLVSLWVRNYHRLQAVL
mmetsp:Transcript_38872/g.62969  ORF Transcript_38872/g.62969 Transcript_38872/m.62969 type:complete len:102 (+) Transcript_38872:3419-3724(+)